MPSEGRGKRGSPGAGVANGEGKRGEEDVDPKAAAAAAALKEAESGKVREGLKDSGVISAGTLADYDVRKMIGKGKFSTVHRAKRKRDAKTVALKKIQIFDMMDAKGREKCLKEVRLLQSLHHPNIIRYEDSFIDGSELIIVFEWAEAGDLKRQIRKAVERGARFDERVAWKYFSQICDAIAHMHGQRVVGASFFSSLSHLSPLPPFFPFFFFLFFLSLSYSIVVSVCV